MLTSSFPSPGELVIYVIVRGSGDAALDFMKCIVVLASVHNPKCSDYISDCN